MTFRPGQWVTCINNIGYSDRLTINKVYLIIKPCRQLGADEFAYVIDDKGLNIEVFSHRFKLVEEEDI